MFRHIFVPDEPRVHVGTDVSHNIVIIALLRYDRDSQSMIGVHPSLLRLARVLRKSFP